jgi:hypothetical protein
LNVRPVCIFIPCEALYFSFLFFFLAIHNFKLQ